MELLVDAHGCVGILGVHAPKIYILFRGAQKRAVAAKLMNNLRSPLWLLVTALILFRSGWELPITTLPNPLGWKIISGLLSMALA